MAGILRYEWRRITSIRSTWILLGLAIVLTAIFSFLFKLGLDSATSNSSSGPDADVGAAGLSGAVSLSASNFIILVALGTVAAQAFGQEYRHGTIRLTLTEFPRRSPVFFAKVLICCFVISIAYVISLVISTAILKSANIVGGASLNGDFLLGLFRSWLYLMGFCLIVFAVTVLTRILALGVIIPLVFAVVLESLLVGLLGSYASWLPDVLPFTSGTLFTLGEDMVRNGLVFFAWVAVLIVAAFAVFERRDA